MKQEQANELSRLAGLWATARCRKALVAHGTGAKGESQESARVREQKANEEFHQYLRALVQPSQRQPLTVAAIREAGGIVHSDGNIFFKNLEQLNQAITGSQQPQQGA